LQYALKIEPAQAAKDAVITVTSSNVYGLEIVSIGEANAEGVRMITLKGTLPTECSIDIGVEGTTVKKQVAVSVTQVRDGSVGNQGSGNQGEGSGTQEGNSGNQGEGFGTADDPAAENTGDGTGSKENKFPILPIAVGGGVVLLAVILTVVILLGKKKKNGTGGKDAGTP